MKFSLHVSIAKVWTMIIFTSLKYFNKMFHNTLEVESIIDNLVKEFIRISGSMVETTFVFKVHLKMKHWSSSAVKETISGDTMYNCH
jgi:hypothetical protein